MKSNEFRALSIALSAVTIFSTTGCYRLITNQGSDNDYDKLTDEQKQALTDQLNGDDIMSQVLEDDEIVDTVLSWKDNVEESKEIDYDKKEWSNLLDDLYWVGYDWHKNAGFTLEYYYSLYYTNHDISYIERNMTGTYEELELDYVGNMAVKIEKSTFENWLNEFFGVTLEELDCSATWNFAMEEDDEFYYFYYAAGYGSLYETRACIYNTSFEEDKATFKVHFYDDFQWKFDEYIDMTPEEVLLDKDTRYSYSAEFYFDIVDGRILMTGCEKLDIPNPVKYNGLAMESEYTDFDVLKEAFKEGKEGYEYSNEWGFETWSKDGWENKTEYWGPVFTCDNENEDMNSKEPVWVVFYNDAVTETDSLGYAAFADNSEIIYYPEGKNEYISYDKELNQENR